MSQATPDPAKLALLQGLQAALPSRIVTRDLKMFAERTDADLEKGVLTFVANGEGSFANTLGRLAQMGTARLLMVGQIKVQEGAEPSVLEDEEDAFIREVKGVILNPPAEIGSLSLIRIRQSSQAEFPYGWFAMELEWLT